MTISIIVAVAENGVIGNDNDLVWNLPTDMNFFKSKTTHHHVIMGRKNWESIPPKWRPLPNRTNIVVSRQSSLELDGALVVDSIEAALEVAKSAAEKEAFIIGGGEIYCHAMKYVDKIYYTEVKATVEGDTWFPKLDAVQWKEVNREEHPADNKNEYAFDFVEYTRK